MMSDEQETNPTPLPHPDHWDDDVLRRYPPVKSKAEFRDYDAEAKPCVKEFYRLNHRYQTVDFVRQERREYLPLRRKRMGVWEALEFLDTLVDDSDPDTDLSQIEHLLQTAEAIRWDGLPRWFILAGLIHDLGKILCLFGEPQWAVVGDTFPVGCAFSPKIVFHEFFRENPDWDHPQYSRDLGIYRRGIGLDQVLMSWGHDEYLYQATKEYLPVEACYMIRYHSFYAAHREHEYDALFDDRDREMFRWVRQFNQYDLYSKSDSRPDIDRLRPFYTELIAEYFPPELDW